MRVIAKSSLKKFGDRPGCGDARVPLRSWYDEAVKATWASPQDVKDQYANARICANNRVVFNIRMDQQGLKARDLEPFIGPSGRVSEVLNRKRRLSLRMIKRLHDELRIPHEILLVDAR